MSFIQNTTAQKVTEYKEVDEQSIDEEKLKNVYGFLMMLLLDSFENQVEMSKVQTKIQIDNSHSQETILNQMNDFRLKDIPLEAWDMVDVRDPSLDKKVRYFDPIINKWVTKIEEGYRKESELVHTELLFPVQLYNQDQMKNQQNSMCSLSALKQSGQLTLTSATSTLKGATSTANLSKEMQDTSATVIRKIVRM